MSKPKENNSKPCYDEKSFRGDISGGVFLIFLGLIFFLNNIGALPWNIWGELWKFWPLLLILGGINHILGRSVISQIIMLFVTLGAFFVVASYAMPSLMNQIPGLPNLPNFANISLPSNISPVTKTEKLGEFTQITLAYPAELTLTNGNDGEISISTDQTTLDKIEWEINENTLVIKSENNWNSNPFSKVYINISSKNPIEQVTAAGSGSFNISNDVLSHKAVKFVITGSGQINASSSAKLIESTIAGSGKITLEGVTQNLNIDIAGSGNFNSQNLVSTNAFVKIVGSGNAVVFVDQKLDIDILGSGKVDYYGSPQITQNIAGSGKINSK